MTLTGYVHKSIRNRSERYHFSPSFAKERSIEMYAFAVNLIGIPGGIRKPPRFKVPVDAELVAYLELDLLTSEDVLDEV